MLPIPEDLHLIFETHIYSCDTYMFSAIVKNLEKEDLGKRELAGGEQEKEEKKDKDNNNDNYYY